MLRDPQLSTSEKSLEPLWQGPAQRNRRPSCRRGKPSSRRLRCWNESPGQLDQADAKNYEARYHRPIIIKAGSGGKKEGVALRRSTVPAKTGALTALLSVIASCLFMFPDRLHAGPSLSSN
jgi:hypothetical protein